ncbi:BTAD domain-containing putative transcriptional regulator [Nonomuraea turcica]|nr:BTAD domain-containing putative transcriptional regulator [Nonomuraea sp. G32]MDP4501646.1 BTAD domain-containing putative transcriptional regulator [Nonomuraea sp. G32]
MVATYPLREGFVAALMRALAEAGRGNEALTVYRFISHRVVPDLWF